MKKSLRKELAPKLADFTGLLVLAVLVGLALLLTSCTDTSSARIQAVNTALNVMTDVVDPAYEVARVACREADKTLITLSETGKLAIADMQQGVAASRKRCDTTFEQFERMIALQDAARAALDAAAERGDAESLQVAEEKLRALRDTWKEH